MLFYAVTFYVMLLIAIQLYQQRKQHCKYLLNFSVREKKKTTTTELIYQSKSVMPKTR